jgi:hypothetical protein
MPVASAHLGHRLVLLPVTAHAAVAIAAAAAGHGLISSRRVAVEVTSA